MKTTSDNMNSHAAIAETYYHEMLNKNFLVMGEFLHPDVHFISPLAEMTGKEAVVEAAKNLSKLFLEDIEIRAKFSEGNQVMFAYDLIFPSPIGKFRAAALMTFQNKLIERIELFYDGRPFEAKKDEIFSRQ